MQWIEEELLSKTPSFNLKRITIPLGLKIFFLFIYIFLFIFYIKTFLINQKLWIISAQKNSNLNLIIPPPRGLIFDRNNNVLATNEVSFDLVIDLNLITDQERLFFEKIIEDNYLDSKINFNQLIIKNIPVELSSKILSQYSNLLKVRLIESYTRKYPLGLGFGNLIGYLGFPSPEEIEKNNLDPNIYIGKLGLEAYYQNYLAGKNGEISFERDTKNNILRTIKNKEPKTGYSLKLTINGEFQKKAYELMDRYMKENNYHKGGLIVLDVRTGEILSLISYPDFDNNIFSKKDPSKARKIFNDPYHPLFNRIVSGLYSPGSVIKPIIALSALEEKIIDPEKKIYSSGELKIPNPYFPGKYSVFKDWKVHGWVNMKEAIANSVNVYFYIIGGGYGDQKGLGIYKIKKYLELFDLNKKTGIDFPNEKNGFIPTPETKEKNLFDKEWRIGDTYNISIGQGDLVITPLRIAVFTAALATNKLIKPYLVKEILDEKQKIIFKNNPQIIKENLVNDKNLKIIQEGMKMTVTNGTAKLLNEAIVKIAGKSGTPEILGKKKLNAFFTGYAPYENPEIVMTLFIEEVPLGSVATLPLYRDLINLYFKSKNKNFFEVKFNNNTF